MSNRIFYDRVNIDFLDDFLSILITSQRYCFDEIVLRSAHQFANTYARSEFTMRAAYFITYRGHLPRDIYVTVAGRKKRVKGMRPEEGGRLRYRISWKKKVDRVDTGLKN